MTEILTPLTELDTDALLAVNGWKHVWADQFMYAYSGKWVWVPFYASILYVLFKNYHWKYVIGCLFAIGLTIAFADQIGASVIRPLVERLRPSNPANPISHISYGGSGERLPGRTLRFPFLPCGQHRRPCILPAVFVEKPLHRHFHFSLGFAHLLLAFISGRPLSGRPPCRHPARLHFGRHFLHLI